MSVKLTSKDRGLKKITSNLTKTKELSVVKIGIIDGGKTHEDDDSDEPLTIGAIGTVHEFGTDDGKIPERSFIRATIEEHRADIVEFQNKLYKKVILGQMELPQALGLLGEKVKSLIIAALDKGIEPALSIFTLLNRMKRTGGVYSDKPLVDSGQLKQSITYKVDA